VRLSLRGQLGLMLATACRPLPYFRGRHRILDTLLPNEGVRTASIYGARMPLDLADFVQRKMFIGSFEDEETRWVKRLLRRGMTAVDVGANVGYYSALAAECVGPTGKVIAFEPNPSAFERLRGWIESNALAHAKCFQIAISNAPGRLALYIPPPSEHHNNANLISGGVGGSSVIVPVQTLDSMLETLAIDRVDFLKVDVEGFELRVMQGAERSVEAGKIRAILAEFHPVTLSRGGTSTEELLRWLQDRGFQLRESTPTNRLLIYCG
jgi:FkbM family methyltransferase